MPAFVEVDGPLFDGRAAHAVRDYCEDFEDSYGQRVKNQVEVRLGQVLKHPTGYYESQIQTDRAFDGVMVHDGGVIYGPWLEGTGSRNAPVTRFKGYRTFRQVGQQAEAMAGVFGDQLMRRYLPRMN